MNRFIQIVFTLSLVLISFSALSQKFGTIKGKIITADDVPAVSVTVSLKGSGLVTKTNTSGEYQFLKVKNGTFTLAVTAIGLTPASKTITISNGEDQVIDFTLSESADHLKEVEVAAKVKRYKIDQPSNSLRLDAPVLEIPQNIQIVTSATLADQQVISMSDGVIRNVSGAVRLEHWGDMYTNILMRGSQIQAFRNGFNVVNSYWGPLTEDMSFVDHIEFVKGPAGFMMANGDPSGLYNVVTKKPTGETKGEASFTLGSFDLYRTTLDLDGKLSNDGRILYRLNFAGQNKKSFRPYEYNNRYSIAPVISYQVDEDTKLTAEYALQYAKMSDVGSFYEFSTNGYASLPRDFTLMQPGLDPTIMKDHSLFLTLEHKLSEQWKVTAQASYFNYAQTGSSMWPSDVFEDNTIIRNVGIWDAKSTMTLGQVFLNGNVNTGAVHHRILAGLDAGTKDYMADWGQYHDLDSVGAPFDPQNPNYGFPVNGFPQFDRTTGLAARALAAGGIIDQRYTGIYLQDELGFLENKLRLTLAARYTEVTQSAWGEAAMSAKRVTPRVGLSYSIAPQFSVYGLYDQAFLPQGGKLENGKSAQPITGNNTEFGIKKDWFGGKWNTTLSAYRILKKNETYSYQGTESAEPINIELGEKVAKGIEFDLRGEIIDGLNATVNYAYTDATITKLDPRVTLFKVGDRVPGFAKHVFNTWLGYKLQSGALKGAGISGGFTYQVDRATQSFNTDNTEQNLPDYFKLDGGLFWEKGNIKLTANVFNILDKYLYSGAYYNGYFGHTPNGVYSWQAEAPRNYRLSIAYKF